jgi:type IV secretory pathway VirB3-like protein
MINLIEQGQDMVVGDRLSGKYFTENKRIGHNFGNKLVSGLIKSFFKSDIKDIMTGYRAFSKVFVRTFPVISKGFEIETEMTIHSVSKDLSVEEIEIEYRDRPEDSESKLNTVSDGIKVIRTIFQLINEYRPLFFYSALAAIAFIVGVIFMIFPVSEYITTGFVTRFPTLIVASFMILIALLLLLVGLILHIIVKKDRKDFEIKYNMMNEIIKLHK